MHRTTPISLASAAFLALAVTGCDRKTSDKNLVFVDPYRAVEVMNQPGSIFEKPKAAAFVDPRPRIDYVREHIPGAISLPFEDMTLEAQTYLGKYQILVVYDTDYDDVICRAASKRLMELGFDSVYSLEGGLKAWKKAGNEVTTGLPADAPELADQPSS
jgi:rhodanese-related sulfurtransferase